MLQDRVAKALREQAALFENTFQRQAGELTDFARQTVEAFNGGGKLLVLGSGPRGAVASLMANLFLHRLALERPLLPAVSLCQDANLATALARDGQERQFFARQLRALATEGDVVLAFGDIHRDAAVEEALGAARELGCTTAALAPGAGEMMGEPPDFLFRVETDSAARAVEAALFFSHLLVELAEGELFGI